MVSPLTFSGVAKQTASNKASFTSTSNEQRNGDKTSAIVAQRNNSQVSDNINSQIHKGGDDQRLKSSPKSTELSAKASTKPNVCEPAFYISPNGLLREVSEHGQQQGSDVEIEAALDDANSFLQSWNIESELKNMSSSIVANGDKGKRIALLSEP